MRKITDQLDTNVNKAMMSLKRYLSLTRSNIDLVKRCTDMAQQPRVLSIQSHVVSGYVGNKSATFPLQDKIYAELHDHVTLIPEIVSFHTDSSSKQDNFLILGFEVDAINSVQFSNHTGYECIKGHSLSDVELGELAHGLEANDLDNGYSHLLTGYIGTRSFLNRIVTLVTHLKKKNKDLIYVCDPVMGDNGKVYVAEDLLPIYRDHIIPLADIITPNQFEVELLTGCKINNVDDAWKAIDKLHMMGVKTVVISSSHLGNEEVLLGLASSISGNTKKNVTVEIPKIPASFIGTGDLFAALFLAWMYKTDDIQIALENAIATVNAVLLRTVSYAMEVGMTPRSLEMKLVQSKADIENPKVKFYSKCR